jgi:hypothetical protein
LRHLRRGLHDGEQRVGPGGRERQGPSSITWLRVYKYRQRRTVSGRRGSRTFRGRACTVRARTTTTGRLACRSARPLATDHGPEVGGIVSQIHHAVYRLPVLCGRLSVPRPVFQLVGSRGRCTRCIPRPDDGRAQPGRGPAHARRGGKMHLLPSPADGGQGAGCTPKGSGRFRRNTTRRACTQACPVRGDHLRRPEQSTSIRWPPAPGRAAKKDAFRLLEKLGDRIRRSTICRPGSGCGGKADNFLDVPKGTGHY